MKRLVEHIEIKGDLVVLSGLRIGAGGGGLEIGGLDNPIVRHPVSRKPYLPGSSVKGKLRSLLETSKFKIGEYSAPYVGDKGGPCGCGRCVVCWLFGSGDVRTTIEPTRLIFRDCQMQQKSVDQFEPLIAEGVFYSEVKAEVVMDRNTGKVGGAGPRNTDRIAADTRLDFRLTVRVLEGDDKDLMKQALAKAFNLLLSEGLGGSVSRGYGQVDFENLTWAGQKWDLKG